MLKVLIKKQFYECFKGYFVSSKTGKAKSKASIIGLFVLFISILLFLAVAFFGMSMSISSLLDTQFSWLYYAIFAIVSIALGTFASVFNTANALYNAKDNDLLLSMPIKPQDILISRISLVYGLSLMYMATVWIPICITPVIFNNYSPLILINNLVLLLIMALFVSTLACAFGYVVALISNKTKNKSVVTTILSLLFLGAYYAVCFKFESIFNVFIENSDKVASTINTWLNLIYQLAIGANGNILGFIIFTIATILLAIICFIILKNNFYKIVTNANNISKTNSKITYKSKNNVLSTLLAKEFKRFISSPVYLMNCGLSSVFVIVLAVAAIVKRNDINVLLEVLPAMLPGGENLIPLIIIVSICLIISIAAIAVPSISLEGKNLWILKSLPIDASQILYAKKQLQFLFNLIPCIGAGIVLSVVLKLEYSMAIYVCVCIFLYIELDACIASIFSLINPNFNWTSETQPVKQAMTNVYVMVIGMIINLLMIGIYFVLREKLSIVMYLEYLIVVLMICVILLRKVINTWGVKTFNKL